MSTMSLDIVVTGWELPGWIQAFYPPDFPDDWRLTYFANEFPAVMVPSKRWMEADMSLLKVWSEDVRDGFRFYLEDPGSNSNPASLGVARHTLGDKLAGLVSERTALSSPRGQLTRFEILDEPGAVPAADLLPAWRIPQKAVGDLGTARDWLLDLSTQAPGGRGLLLLEGEDLDVEDLRRWWNLAWLMGVALA